ncbi:9639_t:CDS:2, partial [Rhizophagus irregularis]
ILKILKIVMEVLETPVGKRTIVKNIIQDIPRTLQIPQADLFTKGQKTELFDDNFRWSENCTEHSLGCPLTLKTKLTNLTSFDFNERAESQATLRKLSCDLEAQYSHDVPSLLNILKSFYPFNETSGDVLEDYEINDFFKLYDISNVRPILASNDNYVFWLEDPAGIIYMWSRVEWSMSYLGRELREALVNYLFHQDNICYVVEFTHEIIPKNEIKQQAKELADSCEPIDIDDIEWKVTRESLNPIKRNEKKGIKKGKNKGKKKKKKH